MGDPKFPKKKYVTPNHPWMRARLESEKVLVKEYGIPTKRELWKMDSIRKKVTDRVRGMIADKSEQAQREKKQMAARLYTLGLVESENCDTDRLLGIQLKDLLERRLQTLVFRKNLANSIKQARQIIVHGHICAGSRKLTSPSHVTTRAEEALIRVAADSQFNNPEHPEMAKQVKPKKAVRGAA